MFNKEIVKIIDDYQNYSSKLYSKTKKYQKIYNFNLGTGKDDTWNNEADAFKHTFGSAELALKYYLPTSQTVGIYHEFKQKNNPPYEENMDNWNNYQGREIAKEIKQHFNKLEIKALIDNGRMDDIIAFRVMEKMKKGELITNPFEDKRSYKNLKKYSSQDFGLNVDHKRIITREELAQMPLDKYSEQEEFVYELLNLGNIMSQREAEQSFNSGELIWVDDYFRDDGTHVSGYYRRK